MQNKTGILVDFLSTYLHILNHSFSEDIVDVIGALLKFVGKVKRNYSQYISFFEEKNIHYVTYSTYFHVMKVNVLT